MISDIKGPNGQAPSIQGVRTGKTGFGVAFDIGTTTIVGALVDLKTGAVLGAKAVPNPQSRWGRDVISRINAVLEDPRLCAEMSRSVVGACSSIIDGLRPEGGITEVTAAGNTVMTHLLLGVSPEPLSRVPYKPAFKEARTLSADDSGISAHGASLYTLPIIGGFVGGDTTAMIIALGLDKAAGVTLALDIGTNSEIVLCAGGVVYATSAAAGPAFEGGQISAGMSAGQGAISSVAIDPDGPDGVRLEVIGSVAPVGICGSGLVDAVSGLLGAGVIDQTGMIRGRDEVAGNLSNRVKGEGGINSFVLYRGPKGEIILTQQDVRALQSAKAAIKAGIMMLLKKAGVGTSDVEKVYIAGAFGANMKKEGLAAIGVLEKGWLDRVESAGDAALNGAILALSDEGKREAEAAAEKAKYVSLSGSAHFEREFIKDMDFR